MGVDLIHYIIFSKGADYGTVKGQDKKYTPVFS